MEEKGVKILRDFIGERMALAMENAKQNPRYLKHISEQVESRKLADVVLGKMQKEDKLTIRRYCESEAAKMGFEMEEIYIQGLKDCVKLFSVLGVTEALGTKVEV